MERYAGLWIFPTEVLPKFSSNIQALPPLQPEDVIGGPCYTFGPRTAVFTARKRGWEG